MSGAYLRGGCNRFGLRFGLRCKSNKWERESELYGAGTIQWTEGHRGRDEKGGVGNCGLWSVGGYGQNE